MDGKSTAVRDMFGRIAPRYDLANSVMTFGLDARWRRRAVECLNALADGCLLDLCCGTGALTRAAAAAVPLGKAIGVDFSPQMLAVARARSHEPNIEFCEADVLALPFEDQHFDGATMGFSMRNITDVGACLLEIARVLKVGARFVNLEVGRPPNPLVRRAFSIYFYRIVPSVGGLVGGDRAAYRYLPQSLVNFPDEADFAALFAANGFTKVRYERMLLGAAVIHVGEKMSTPATPLQDVAADRRSAAELRSAATESSAV